MLVTSTGAKIKLGVKPWRFLLAPNSLDICQSESGPSPGSPCPFPGQETEVSKEASSQSEIVLNN